MSKQKITVPDIGDAEDVEVIELCVAPGDEVVVDDILIVVESDKASMEIPSPVSGKVTSLAVKLGESVSFGTEILTLEHSDEELVLLADKAPLASEEPLASRAPRASKAPLANKEQQEGSEPKKQEAQKPEAMTIQTIRVPDIGDSEAVVVIELLVKLGDSIDFEDLLIVIESDKASMEIPSPFAGVVEKILVKEGDEVTEGSALFTVVSSGSSTVSVSTVTDIEVDDKQPLAKIDKTEHVELAKSSLSHSTGKAPDNPNVYAGPAVRKLARELGVTLPKLSGTGAGGRITKDDVHAHVKRTLSRDSGSGTGSGIPSVPVVDFTKFGSTEILPLSRIRKRGAENLHRSWLNVPHVTQNDEADVSDLEDFRKRLAGEAKRRNVRLTPLAFIIKAVCFALKEYPIVNSSLDASGENYILKKYYNIGMAVDTPDGLVVPVLRGVDDKGIWSIAAEIVELSEKARLGKLSMTEMQGASFTISSLGPIGGTSFTPIVNAPEVAILGVSRLSVKPQWDGEEFVPRKMLPVSLSYDHRAINGAEAGRFTTFLCAVLKDFREGIM